MVGKGGEDIARKRGKVKGIRKSVVCFGDIKDFVGV